jgi:malate/lactate dehydrogenase
MIDMVMPSLEAHQGLRHRRGNVGMAIAQTILTSDLVDEIGVGGRSQDKLCGEMLDLQHAVAFLPRMQG